MQRRKIAAANWKMNLSIRQGLELVREIARGIPGLPDCAVVIAPPLTHLQAIGEALASTPMQLGAQHCHFERSGAYTGEVSVAMLTDLGVRYIITGHSERRQIFGEDNEFIRLKVLAILAGGCTPIFCCGEPLPVREAGDHLAFVQRQLEESVCSLEVEEFSRLVIAYEPIWAIGTGVTASPEQAEEMHAFIRSVIADRYDEALASSVQILYGGSIKADNAHALFSKPNVDGGLVGGASLQAAGFIEIIRAACG